MTTGALALRTPPMSDRGSITQPLALEERVQSLGITDSPLPTRPQNATVVCCLSIAILEGRCLLSDLGCETYSRKRKIAPDRDQSHHREPSPEEKPGPSNPRKRAKSIAHVLVPPLSEEKRRAFSKAPMTAYEEDFDRPGPSRSARTKREREDSVRPVQPAERSTRHLRARSRELSYLDPPIPTRTSLRPEPSRVQGGGEASLTQSGDVSKVKHSLMLLIHRIDSRNPPI